MDLQEFCVAMLGRAVKLHLEPKCNNLPLWENGLGKLAEGLVKASVPPVTGDQVAQNVLAAMGVGQPRIARSRVPQIRAMGAGDPRGSGRVIDAEVIR